MEAGVPRETGQARPQEMLGGADSFANLSEAVRRLHWEALTHVEGGCIELWPARSRTADDSSVGRVEKVWDFPLLAVRWPPSSPRA